MLVLWACTNLPPLYDEYSFKYSLTRMVVEHGFGILKGIWRILKRLMFKPGISQVLVLIMTYCILHDTS